MKTQCAENKKPLTKTKHLICNTHVKLISPNIVLGGVKHPYLSESDKLIKSKAAISKAAKDQRILHSETRRINILSTSAR